MPKSQSTNETPLPANWRHPAVFLATGFWAGRAPFAPGTVGALWGLPLAWGLSFISPLWLQAAVIVAICLAGIPICTIAARQLGGLKDPGAIVLDEIVSLPITFFLVPATKLQTGSLNTVVVYAVGFALHRLFDITKPPPARQLERLPDGLGIMADDWAAGAFSCLALHAILWSG
ncbi:MAG TPA: phosphatidylglycerophosphatase A, partial [Pirellulales bacterium]